VNRELKAAYNACSGITRRKAKNFYFAFITLPKKKRRAIYAVYAFCCEADDIADSDISLAEKVAALARLRVRLAALTAGDPQTLADYALADTIARFSVDPKNLSLVIDGVEMDLTVFSYETFTDLRRYCHLVASAVGLSVLPILAQRRGRGLLEEAHEFGEALGLGMQLANIVRDVAEDMHRERVYIPGEDLEHFGVTEEMLRASEATEKVQALLAFEIERARGYLYEGKKLLPYLPRHARRCPMLLSSLYSRILDRIEAKGYDVFSSRVSLSTAEKLILTFRTWVQAFLR
jgi:phytoene synthase